jgi:hypothetical protein
VNGSSAVEHDIEIAAMMATKTPGSGFDTSILNMEGSSPLAPMRRAPP